MKILVTGGAGYLGSILVEGLLHHLSGHEVVVVDTFEHGCLSLAHLVALPRLTILREPVIGTHTDGVDAIIHLAAIVGAPACEVRPNEASSINEQLTNLLAFHAKRSGIPIIYPCTNSGYGIGGEETCTEESPLNPISIYGQTKMFGEGWVIGAGGVSLRLATLFGWSPRMRRDLLVNDLTWRAVRDQTAVIFEGGFRRNFLHVRDAARAFIHVLDNWDAMKGQVYNVGDTRANTTKIGLCQAIAEVVPGFRYLTSDVGEDPDKRDYIVSNHKIEATGWRPNFSLHDGIRELVRGYAMMRREEHGNV